MNAARRAPEWSVLLAVKDDIVRFDDAFEDAEGIYETKPARFEPGSKGARPRAGAPVGDSRYAAMATLLRKGAAPDVGTGLGNLVEVLQEYGVTSVEHRGGAALKVKAAAKAGQMAIAQVEWGGGGSHFIVVHGQAGDKYCILDPGSNTLVQTEAVGSTTYTAPYGLTGLYIACAVVS